MDAGSLIAMLPPPAPNAASPAVSTKSNAPTGKSDGEPRFSPADETPSTPNEKPVKSSTPETDSARPTTSSDDDASKPMPKADTTTPDSTTPTDQATTMAANETTNALILAQATQASVAAQPVVPQPAQITQPPQDASVGVQTSAQPAIAAAPSAAPAATTPTATTPTAPATAAPAAEALAADALASPVAEAPASPTGKTPVSPTALQSASTPPASQAKAKADTGASTTQTSTYPDQPALSSGEDGAPQPLTQGARPRPSNVAQQSQNPSDGSSTAAPNSSASPASGGQASTQQAAQAAAPQLDATQQAASATDGNAAAAIQSKPDSAPPVAAAFSTDLIGHAGAKTATSAYEAARVAAPIQPASEQVALSIHRAVEDGVDRLTVELKPASLGRVSAEIEFHDDHRVHVVLSADRPATLDALRNDSRALERALQDAGLRADSGSLSFRFQNSGDQPGFTPGGTPASFAAPSGVANDDVIATTMPTGALLRPGGVDIHV